MTPPNLEFLRLKNVAGARLEWAVEKLRLPDSTSTASISLLYRQFVFWRYFRRATKRRLNPARDCVLLPYLAACGYAIALLGTPFGSAPWAGISMRAIFHFPEVGIKGAPGAMSPDMQKYFFERLARDPYLLRLFFIDETILTCPTMAAELRSKSRYLPDPSELPIRIQMNAAREQLGLGQQNKVILMYGAISQRKGFARLLNVLASPDLSNDVIALVVGQFDNGCREALCRWLEEDMGRSRRIVFKDRYVSSTEEAQCLNACDMVWLAYESHLTMSGVLVQAGLYRKPVLGTDAGLIGWYITHRKVGVTLASSTVAETVSMISQLAAQPDALEQFGANGDNTFKNNTVENFQAALFGKINATYPSSEPFA